MPLYASAPIAYDGTVYARIHAARWSRDCTKIWEFLGLLINQLNVEQLNLNLNLLYLRIPQQGRTLIEGVSIERL